MKTAGKERKIAAPGSGSGMGRIGAGAIFVSMFLAFIFFVAVAFLGNLLKVRIISKKIELAGAVKGAEAKAGLDILKKVQE